MLPSQWAPSQTSPESPAQAWAWWLLHNVPNHWARRAPCGGCWPGRRRSALTFLRHPETPGDASPALHGQPFGTSPREVLPWHLSGHLIFQGHVQPRHTALPSWKPGGTSRHGGPHPALQPEPRGPASHPFSISAAPLWPLSRVRSSHV